MTKPLPYLYLSTIDQQVDTVRNLYAGKCRFGGWSDMEALIQAIRAAPDSMLVTPCFVVDRNRTISCHSLTTIAGWYGGPPPTRMNSVSHLLSYLKTLKA